MEFLPLRHFSELAAGSDSCWENGLKLGQVILRSELEANSFLLESSRQDWLAVGVEQPEDKNRHGCSCSHTGRTLAEAPAKHSVSTGCTSDATGFGNP